MKLIQRRHSRQVTVRGLPMGGGAPIPVQSMTTTRTDDAAATMTEIEHLESAGYQIVRLTVPDEVAIRGFAEVRKRPDQLGDQPGFYQRGSGIHVCLLINYRV